MTISTYIDVATFVRLSKMADDEGVSISKIIGRAVDSFCAKRVVRTHPDEKENAVVAAGEQDKGGGAE